jgi:hypothetical protein
VDNTELRLKENEMSMIKNAVYKPKNCRACHSTYTPTGAASKYCVECGEFRHLWGKWRDARAKTIKAGGNAGVGSGGQNIGGVTEWNYRERLGKEVYEFQNGLCYDCAEEFTFNELLMHHKDHNRKNNALTNFAMVCKRCHQVEHDCGLAFSKA